MQAGGPDPSSPEAIRAELAELFAGVRENSAPGPGPDADALRGAYLGVLKLALCDLAGRSTRSVKRTPDGLAYTELEGVWMKTRALGMDWPHQGLTMVGLQRLDDLQACVESVVSDDVPGDLIEAGTWRGGASILARATLDTLGAHDRTLVVADSFQGFPPGGEEEELALIHYLAVSLEEVRANFARFGVEDGVEFIPGFFEESMPKLRERTWSLIRLDGDTFEATSAVLDALYPQLSVGGYLIVDDYRAFEGCLAAVDAFRARHGITEPLERVDWTCVRWRRTNPAPITVGAPRPDGPDLMPSEKEPAPAVRIPTTVEQDLLRDLTLLRRRSLVRRLRERLRLTRD